MREWMLSFDSPCKIDLSTSSVVGQSKQTRIPETGHKSVDISSTSRDMRKWTSAVDSACQIGLFIHWNDVLIVVLGPSSANQNKWEFRQSDTNSSISPRIVEIRENGHRQSIRHIK